MITNRAHILTDDISERELESRSIRFYKFYNQLQDYFLTKNFTSTTQAKRLVFQGQVIILVCRIISV